MHHFEAIFQKYPGEDPRTPTCGGGGVTTSPFRRFTPQWILRLQLNLGAPAILIRATEEKKLDTPDT